ncbi:hypothetical protein NLJ89_g1426 [Agrocybe chaxingu]|uniref:Uncharacterized protein n=1 Tax=Agrocybe chaxingu TaxID=84603 RepID=A0A9W8TF92_9AGAR|nr:hypothetical protein NLJ89_g1426 [Agrocybe chaxingu]
MLESYDMQMLDYPADTDISMHPSSSDQWFPDEAKMEEDVPLKVDNFEGHHMDAHVSMKTDFYSQEREDATIEIDMEPLIETPNVEYEMGDGEDLHEDDNLVDVEVYDASRALSPSIPSTESGQVAQPALLHPSAHLEESADINKVVLPEPPSHASLPNHSPSIHEVVPGVEVTTDLALPERHALSVSEPATSSATFPDEIESNTTNHHFDPFVLAADREDPHPEQYEVVQETLPSSELLGLADEPVASILPSPSPPLPNTAERQETLHGNLEEGSVDHLSAQSTGDPHEISEGVYIDPPPPVLLAVAPDEVFEFTLFNDLSNGSPTSETNIQMKGVLLQHLPTLYYEPLSTVFETLRQEQHVQSKFHLADSELVLDAIDLSLPISEDNAYAREVTLHDLNVLHDAYGIAGPLRMKLHSVTPRFIARYQYLQENIGQLELGQPSVDLTTSVDAIDNEQAKSTEFVFKKPDLPHDSLEGVDPTALSRPKEGAREGAQADDLDYSEATKEHRTSEPQPEYEDEEERAGKITDDLGDDHSESEASNADDEARLPHDTTNNQQSLGDRQENAEPDSIEDQGSDPSVVELDVLEAKFSNGNPFNDEEASEQIRSSSSKSQSQEHEDPVGVDPVVYLETEDGGVRKEQVEYPDQDEVGPEWPEYDEQGHEDYEDSEEHDDDEHGDYEGSEEHHDDASGEEDQAVTRQDEERARPENSLALGPLGTGTVDDKTVGREGDSLDLDSPPEQAAVATEAERDVYDNSGNDDQGPSLPDAVSHQSPEPVEGDRDADRVGGAVTEVPFGPVLFDGEAWDDDLDREGDLDARWDEDNTPSASNQSSVTLSSKTSKRSFDEFESNGEGCDEIHVWEGPSSPDSKRSRTR